MIAWTVILILIIEICSEILNIALIGLFLGRILFDINLLTC